MVTFLSRGVSRQLKTPATATGLYGFTSPPVTCRRQQIATDMVEINDAERNCPDKLGRLLADCASNPIHLYSVSVTSLAAWLTFIAVRKHYVLLDVTRDGVDTVGVCGSNPHAPTN